MMRYQRVSPDIIGIPSGRKPTSIRSCKDDDADVSGRISGYPPFDVKPLRVRSGSGSPNPSTTQTQDESNGHSSSHNFAHFSSSADPHPQENPKSISGSNPEISGWCSGWGGDVLLQWGHKKRSRGSRAESRTAGDESSVRSRHPAKIQRRAAIAGAEKIAASAAAQAMPPPCGGGYARGTNLRACMPLRDSAGIQNNRSVEERSSGHHNPRSDKRSPPSPPEKPAAHNSSTNHKTAAAAAAAAGATSNGFGPEAASSMNHHESKPPSDQDTVSGGTGGGGAAAAAAAKVNLEQFEWPRIYISLSRKEKEDDFLAMRGTKLPQRPKKRAKNIDKALQYCFPGLWLTDLTRGRYEVREKKCVKKKRRGLKGMESMDSDSE